MTPRTPFGGYLQRKQIGATTALRLSTQANGIWHRFITHRVLATASRASSAVLINGNKIDWAPVNVYNALL